MADKNVHKAGFTPSGIAKGSIAASMMSREAKASGGGVRSGGPTSTLQEMGMINSVCVISFVTTTHTSGYTSDGISRGTSASERMSQEARSHGGGTPKGSTTSAVQSI
ncbi:IFI27 protein, partial [Tyrannus savana]|nr:IFI27 protein [Tyrannus savana]